MRRLQRLIGPHLLPRLRTIFLALNLFVLLLPIGGIGLLRIYDSQLVRQTEIELLSQAAVLDAVWRDAYGDAESQYPSVSHRPVGSTQGTIGDATADLRLAYDQILQPAPGRAARMTATSPGQRPVPVQIWQPLQPRLDLASDPIGPPPRDPEPAFIPIDPAAARAGARLRPMIDAIQLQTLSDIRLLDRSGILVAGTAGRPEQAPGRAMSLAHLPEIRQARDGSTVSVMRARDDTATGPLTGLSRQRDFRVFIAHPVQGRDQVIGVILLSRTPASAVDGLYNQRFVVGLAAGLALLAMVTLSLATSRLVARPVEALIRQSRLAADGNPGGETPVAVPVSREFAELSRAMASMAATLDRRARYIRDFATRVSHEFKTPLTAIDGSVELLRDHGAAMTPPERDRFLSTIDRNTDRLTRLVSRLMEMARADVIAPAGGVSTLAAAIDPIRERLGDHGVGVTSSVAADLRVAMGRDVAETVFINLCDNARLQGATTITIDAGTVDGSRRVDRLVTGQAVRPMVTVTVTDDGPGVPDGKADAIFTPFYTTRRGSGGTGLGLSIVRSLVEAHGGRIELRPPDPDGLRRGASFRLDLPAAAGPA